MLKIKYKQKIESKIQKVNTRTNSNENNARVKESVPGKVGIR